MKAYWILDSRSMPTVQVEVAVNHGDKSVTAKGASPSGASTGSHEAVELRDDNEAFMGKGVDTAVANVNNQISEKLKGFEFDHPKEIDDILIELDGTENKSNLGANAILAVSIAIHKACSHIESKPLYQYLRETYFTEVSGYLMPKLMSNVLNGGKHADNGISIQEFMIVSDYDDLNENIQATSEIYNILKKNLKKENLSTGLGDEGGFAPKISSTRDVLDKIKYAIEFSNHKRTKLALDCAATEYYENDSYLYEGKNLTKEDLNEEYNQLVKEYDIISIEDGFSEDDLEGWKIHTDSLGDDIMLVGDDLFVTNPKRFDEIGVDKGIGNSVLIKMNQIGTVSETVEMIEHAHRNQYSTVISHRSGETTDPFMSDLCVAAGSEYIKLGAPARGERVAKFNRLIEINQKIL